MANTTIMQKTQEKAAQFHSLARIKLRRQHAACRLKSARSTKLPWKRLVI